jgi:hypothetical protein
MPAEPQLDTTSRKARRILEREILEREGTVTAGVLAQSLDWSQRHG